MTRDEAIKVLSNYDVNGVWADVDGKPYNAKEQAEAFDMAIEALQELPKRRKEAKRWKTKALQAEPVKHGKWINKRLTKDSIKDIKDGTYGELIGYHDICSVCGFDIDEFWYATGSPDYCPNCGANMKGQKDD